MLLIARGLFSNSLAAPSPAPDGFPQSQGRSALLKDLGFGYLRHKAHMRCSVHQQKSWLGAPAAGSQIHLIPASQLPS